MLVETSSIIMKEGPFSMPTRTSLEVMDIRFAVAITLVCVFCISISSVHAQDTCVTYKLVPHTSYKKQPTTLSGLVNDTVMETKRITTYKPVWTRETRQRTSTVLKPIIKTSERVERYLVRRPIVETSYREKQVEETSYETVTEYKEERYLIERPIVETQMREEKYLVRKPVSTTMMQTENVTTLRPVEISETQLVAGATVSDDLVLTTGRNRLRWLQPGYYVDPASGWTDYKRRGLHWVPDQALALQTTIEPALLQQQVTRTAYAPETVEVRKPVQVTRYIDQVETRKVPVQVQTTSRKIQTVRTPVTVKKPVTKIKTERIPIREVKYREEVYERRVPTTETTYQRVEKIEPYDVEICKWVAETKEVQVPTTVTRRVDYSIEQLVPETTWMRVPVDAFGNVVAAPEILTRESRSTTYRLADNFTDRIRTAPIVESRLKPIIDTSERSTVIGEPIIVRKLDDDEARKYLGNFDQQTPKPNSVLVPESGTNGKPISETIEVKKRPIAEGSSTKQEADQPEEADQQPILIDEPDVVELRIESSDAADIDRRPNSSSGDSGLTDLN